MLGDFNVNLIDRNKKLIHEKGYRFLKDEKKYSTSIHLTKNYSQLLKTNGLKQIINNPTRITDTTKSLLDHILVNTPNKISQSGVISKGFTTMIIFILLGNTLKQNQVNITLLRLDP